MSSKRYPEEFKIEAVKQITERGHKVADVWSAPPDPHALPATAGRTGIGHTHSADFDTE